MKKIPPERSLLLFCLLVAVLTGCGSNQGQTTARNIEQHVWSIGEIRPGTSSEFEIEVHNPTAFDWTVKEVDSPCACTVISQHSNQVKAGRTESFTVTYKAPKGVKDDSRTVYITFQEADAPIVSVEVSALVRPEIVCQPKLLTLYATEGLADSVTGNVELMNFTDFSQEDVKPHTTAEWLTVKTEKFSADDRSNRKPGEALESWRFQLAADTRQLSVGNHLTHITLDTEDVAPISVPVRVIVRKSVRVIPPRLFFDRMAGRSPRESLVRICTQSDVSAQEITFEHDLGDGLQLQLQQESARTLLLTATLSSDAVPAEDASSIDVMLPVQGTDRTDRITIPVVVGGQQ